MIRKTYLGRIKASRPVTKPDLHVQKKMIALALGGPVVDAQQYTAHKHAKTTQTKTGVTQTRRRALLSSINLPSTARAMTNCWARDGYNHAGYHKRYISILLSQGVQISVSTGVAVHLQDIHPLSSCTVGLQSHKAV